MNVRLLTLPLLLSSTLAISACGGQNSGQVITQDQTDNTHETDTGNTNTDNTDQTDTNDNEPTLVTPAKAQILESAQEVTLENGVAKFNVSWEKEAGENGLFWKVLVNGQSVMPFFALSQNENQTQSGQYEIDLNTVGDYAIQVQLCPSVTASPYCSVSESHLLKVNEDPTQFQSNLGLPLFAAWNTQLCLSAILGGVSLGNCNNERSQRWVMENEQIRSAADTRLCIQAANLDYSASLSLTTCDKSTKQQWSYENNNLRNQDWALDINISNSQVIVWNYHGNTNQQWLTTLEIEEPDSDNNNAGSGNKDQWTQVDVAPNGRYGSQEFAVPAAQNWVNTGLYLRSGQSAQISATGLWAVKGGTQYGPNGSSSDTSRGCQLGELTARLGLYYKDEAISCIGTNATFTAHEDGILYVGAVVSNDLGETYEARKSATGMLQVVVTSEGETVPTIAHDVAPYYDYDAVTSGWVEIRSSHNILTLPVATAKKDASKLTQAGDRLDDIYVQHKSLRGKTPYFGQPIRWFGDTKDAPGWMLAGNPVRMDPALIDANGSSRITLAAEPGNNDWGFAHELGHNFNFSGGDWYYTTYAGLEAWPNVFSMHAIEQLGLPARDTSDCPERKAEYLAKNTHENGLGGAWNGLCFLNEFTDIYGWGIWKDFYQEFNQLAGHGWAFLRDRLNAAAGEDTTAIFESWNIPL